MLIRLRRFAAEIWYAVLPALVTAAVHLLIVTARRPFFPKLHWDWNWRDVYTMVPAGYLVTFAVLSIPLALVAFARRDGLPQRARVWFWTSLSVFAVLLLFRRVHSIAWLLVALGAGYQVAVWALRSPTTWRRALRVAGAVVGIVIPLLGIGSLVRGAGAERRLLASLPAAQGGAPNVLLIIWDTARAQSMSLYGYERKTTPFLDSLAHHAVVFDYAYATAPWTLPSHASMLTGLYPGHLTADWTTPLNATHRTLAEALYRDGYATGAFIANFFAASYPTGLHRGFIRYEAEKRTFEEVILSTTLTQARSVQSAWFRIRAQRWYRQAVMDLLRFDWRPSDTYQVHDRKDGTTVTSTFLHWQTSLRRPWFAMLNYMEAHAGSATPLDTMFAGGRKRNDQYDGSLLWLDNEMRRLFTSLAERGQLERTIVVVTSDHGEQFGDHGIHGHGESLYTTVLQVPLLIYAPGRLPAGLRVRRAVSLRDIARTVQHLASSGQEPFPGASLAAMAADSSVAPSPVIGEVSNVERLGGDPSVWDNMISALDDTLHVIRDFRGKIEAYSYRADIAEANDLARDETRRKAFGQWLEQIVQSAGLHR